MTDPRASSPPDPPGLALWLVCAPHAWAWGWGDHRPPQSCVESAWPEGEPPLSFPAELWRVAWQRAVQDQPLPIDVHVLCASWGRDSAPDWWPHHKAGVRQWQTWLASLGGQLQSVAQAQADPDTGDLKTWVQRARWQRALNVASMPHRPAAGLKPWQGLAISSLAALGVHALMLGAVQPLWLMGREQAQLEAEQQRQDALARQAQEAAQRQKAEQAAQAHRWRQEQHAALQPLHELGRWLQQSGPEPVPQLWLELRHAQGAWTVSGVASHAMGLHELLPAAHGHEHALIHSGTSTWPAEPALGWPAWRFEWQAAAADPNHDPAHHPDHDPEPAPAPERSASPISVPDAPDPAQGLAPKGVHSP